MTYADLQGKSASASSNPAVRDRIAKSNRKVPGMSTRPSDDLESLSERLVVRLSVLFQKPKSFGIPSNVNPRATLDMGTLEGGRFSILNTGKGGCAAELT